MAQYWSVVGQLLVSRWLAESGVRSLVGNPCQFVIDIIPISLKVYSVIMFGLIILVKIDNNLATGGIVYPLHLAVLEPRLFCLFYILKNMLLGNP